MLEYLTNIAKLCDELSWAQVTDAADSTYDSLRWDNWGLQRISGGFEAGDVILCVISGKKDRNRRIWDIGKGYYKTENVRATAWGRAADGPCQARGYSRKKPLIKEYWVE